MLIEFLTVYNLESALNPGLDLLYARVMIAVMISLDTVFDLVHKSGFHVITEAYVIKVLVHCVFLKLCWFEVQLLKAKCVHKEFAYSLLVLIEITSYKDLFVLLH